MAAPTRRDPMQRLIILGNGINFIYFMLNENDGKKLDRTNTKK